MNRRWIHVCYANFYFSLLIAYNSGDVCFAAWWWDNECCLWAGNIEINIGGLGLVVVFASLPVCWPIGTAAFELVLREREQKMTRLLLKMYTIWCLRVCGMHQRLEFEFHRRCISVERTSWHCCEQAIWADLYEGKHRRQLQSQPPTRSAKSRRTNWKK